MDQKTKLTYSIILNFILLLTLFYFYPSTAVTSLETKSENESETLTFHESKLGDKISNKINTGSQVKISLQHTTESLPKNNKVLITHQEQEYSKNQKMIEFQKEFDEKNEKAYGYFKKIRDFSEAFESDEYSSEWSSKMVNDINDTILYDVENSMNRFPAIAVDDLECRGTLCKIDFQNISDNVADWDTQRSALRDALMRLGGRDNQWNRAVKTSWLENGKIRYYISKGVSEIEPALDNT